MALLHLAREAWLRVDSLPFEAQADLRSTLGFTMSQEDVLAKTGVQDAWIVAGQWIEEEDRIRTQRTWLFGENTKRWALCLSFSAGPNQPLDVSLVPGTRIKAELAFYPSAFPLRALIKQRQGSPESAAAELPHATISDANAFAAEALMTNPWLEKIPFAFRNVIPGRRSFGWIVRDESGHALPLKISDDKAWNLVALSGGRPLALVGEWNGEAVFPLSVWAEGRFLRL